MSFLERPAPFLGVQESFQPATKLAGEPFPQALLCFPMRDGAFCFCAFQAAIDLLQDVEMVLDHPQIRAQREFVGWNT